MIGKLKDMLRGRNGEWVISFTTTTDFSEAFNELADKEVNIEIKQFRNKRSLDANAYCWVLIGKIAEKTGLKRREIYRNAIKDIGGVYDVVCVQNKAVDRLREGWEKNGLGWQSDTLKSQIPDCTNVVLYYGSSVYDTKQMAQLISSLVQDAEALGIPTISDSDAVKMLGKWATKS